ncbi:TNF receptor-associated factor family protein DDB_G0272098-like [Pieris brassicae]|uniref:TNF receptor-associated factor family protein DDB_G0272098-like n=1 Tax=Pieris brassicae TaxID=7116 RepID=UPI001E6601E2|nr:TNF receptor-associated factor family protein DDB_G0272098-like [Pieris brassicae]
MDWKLIAVLNIVICVTTAHPPRAAKSEQTFIKYFGKEEKINAENDKSERQEEYVESYPSYEFSYKVSDPHTHDFKGQQEKRHGDKVNGNYWLIQPDGRKRLVKYHANDHIGFNVLIDYSQKHNEKGEGAENKENGESNAKNENEKRTWHVIHDYKMKKSSREGGSQQESNASTGQSEEKTESGQTEGQDQQNSRQNEVQEADRSRNSQEGRREKSKESTERNLNQRRKEGGGSKEKNESQNRQESSRGNSNEQQNSGQSVSSKENSKSEKSGEKIYWYRIPHKYLRKGYEVIEENKEEERDESKESNEGVGGRSTETANEQSAEGGNKSNEEKNEASGEQNSARRESSENESKEKVYGYKSYVYHIRH